jgi:hypothetical protein
MVKNQQSTVIVSQSWSEIHKVNERVREGLKAQKLIGETETTVTTLERMDLTDAQKRDKRFYNADAVLVFNRPVVGFKQGEHWKIARHHGQTFARRIGKLHPASSVQSIWTKSRFASQKNFHCPLATGCNSKPMTNPRMAANLPTANWSR